MSIIIPECVIEDLRKEHTKEEKERRKQIADKFLQEIQNEWDDELLCVLEYIDNIVINDD